MIISTELQPPPYLFRHPFFQLLDIFRDVRTQEQSGRGDGLALIWTHAVT